MACIVYCVFVAYSRWRKVINEAGKDKDVQLSALSRVASMSEYPENRDR